MRRPLIVANWKMHKTVSDAVAYLRDFVAAHPARAGVDVGIAPPFTALTTLASDARRAGITLAAQNVAIEREGAFTGEVSAIMAKDAGATYGLVGHSERRRLFGETDDVVHRKLGACRAAGLVPILCVGETLDERDAGKTQTVLDRQLGAALEGLHGDEVSAVVIAYEPVWAIGTGRNATAAEAGAAHAHARARVRQWFGAAPADTCRIICGGSVRPDTIAELMAEKDVDGALVGGASLDVHSFGEIVRNVVPRA